ncbi:hypothetical protein ACQR1Y_12125 [Bradyrhizobium sp. HKCCYLRH3099]|uniref:hypothetical protein n=1 Tax=unclassified Bradyrhizobium TaxID=2631580 RepID=UPI003EB8F907
MAKSQTAPAAAPEQPSLDVAPTDTLEGALAALETGKLQEFADLQAAVDLRKEALDKAAAALREAQSAYQVALQAKLSASFAADRERVAILARFDDKAA